MKKITGAILVLAGAILLGSGVVAAEISRGPYSFGLRACFNFAMILGVIGFLTLCAGFVKDDK